MVRLRQPYAVRRLSECEKLMVQLERGVATPRTSAVCLASSWRPDTIDIPRQLAVRHEHRGHHQGNTRSQQDVAGSRIQSPGHIRCWCRGRYHPDVRALPGILRLPAGTDYGIKVPFVPGIMGVTTFGGLQRVSGLCKTRWLAGVLEKAEVAGTSDDAMHAWMAAHLGCFVMGPRLVS